MKSNEMKGDCLSELVVKSDYMVSVVVAFTHIYFESF